MDFTEAWSKTTDLTKSAYDASATVVVNTLDSVSPAFVPFATWWDRKADARLTLRTEENLKALIKAQREYVSARSTAATASAQRRAAKANSKNPLSADRRATRKADKAASGHKAAAKADLKGAAANYPQKLTTVAAKWQALHTVGTVGWSVAEWAHTGAIDLLPPFASAALIAALPTALWLGHRQITVVVDDDASAEERRLMERLAPTYWVQHAEARGLSGTVTENPELTPAGIVCGVRLDFKWSAKELASKADAVRALLGMKTETRMQISRGSHGDRALMVIRTRSASDGVSMIWTPDHVGIGVDEVTGEFVDLPLKAGTHVLAAGRTGMGKSVSWRPLVMRAVMADDWTAVVIDPKRQEAIGWQHCLRCVGAETDREERLERIYAMAKELTREMHRRQGMATGATWVPDGRPENRNLLVVIDEGAAIVRMSKQKQYKDVLDLFEELWSEARSVGYQFVWATQFPTKAVGVPAAVKENMSAFLSLTVNPGEAERAIFGENAQQEGWLPSRLDGVPGRAMLQYQTRGSDPVRLWHVTDGMVAGVPTADPWFSPATVTVTETATVAEVPAPAPAPAIEGRPALRLVKDGGDFLLAPPTPAAEVPDVLDGLTDNQRAVYESVRDGAATNAEISKATGLNPGSVARAVDALVKRDALAKDGTAIRLGGAA